MLLLLAVVGWAMTRQPGQMAGSNVPGGSARRRWIVNSIDVNSICCLLLEQRRQKQSGGAAAWAGGAGRVSGRWPGNGIVAVSWAWPRVDPGRAGRAGLLSWQNGDGRRRGGAVCPGARRGGGAGAWRAGRGAGPASWRRLRVGQFPGRAWLTVNGWRQQWQQQQRRLGGLGRPCGRPRRSGVGQWRRPSWRDG